eukprot:TRINITY_DN26162_c0_g1_i1.p1 TRINITY_DN26162_c0_g1~~TRINITY_DN26162_c0_g1_i1.p1  ORF type:complete len:150 (-),score=23.24 TRINITY_DN26162_c0_g1_i1:34-483(-)
MNEIQRRRVGIVFETAAMEQVYPALMGIVTLVNRHEDRLYSSALAKCQGFSLVDFGASTHLEISPTKMVRAVRLLSQLPETVSATQKIVVVRDACEKIVEGCTDEAFGPTIWCQRSHSPLSKLRWLDFHPRSHTSVSYTHLTLPTKRIV